MAKIWRIPTKMLFFCFFSTIYRKNKIFLHIIALPGTKNVDFFYGKCSQNSPFFEENVVKFAKTPKKCSQNCKNRSQNVILRITSYPAKIYMSCAPCCINISKLTMITEENHESYSPCIRFQNHDRHFNSQPGRHFHDWRMERHENAGQRGPGRLSAVESRPAHG